MKELSKMTFQEKTLRAIICDLRDEIVGGFSNTCLDYGKEEAERQWPLKNRTKQVVVDEILAMILNGDSKYIQSSMRPIALERKHLKFMGKQFIKELIEDRVEYDYRHGGWDFPNNYHGDLE